MIGTSSNNDFTALKRYVRVQSAPEDKFVEFDFAIGYPELFVELVLPRDAFKKFCEANNVIPMDKEMAKLVDEDIQKWRFGDTRKS